MIRKLYLFLCILLFGMWAFAISAEEHAEHNLSDDEIQRVLESDVESQMQEVSYPAEFFAQYRPNTALDMVQQLPGFQLDDGDNTRGFGGAAGNILINNRRPGGKQDRASAVLGRISASQVRSIELINNQVEGVDLLGHSVVANVLLDSAAAVVNWSTFVRYDATGPEKPGVALSLSNSWRDIDYNFGINLEREANGEKGQENIFDGGDELLEFRHDRIRKSGLRPLAMSFNSSGWIGESFVQVNSKFNLTNGPDTLVSERISYPSNLHHKVIFKDSINSPSFELGTNIDRQMSGDLSARSILLFTYDDTSLKRLQSNVNSDGIQTSIRMADIETLSKEGIGRLEFDWSGFNNHSLRMNLEGAYNVLDNYLFQTFDAGSGPVVQDIPGANSKVKETRGDLLLKDVWSLGQLELEYGLGAEISSISQTGDVDLKRNFFYLKPQGMLSYSFGQDQLLRIRIAREVSQLNFNDFVSATGFQGDDLVLGNPNLRPDRTWLTEMSYEKRFGQRSVIKVTTFYHRIDDVLDLLPLTATTEVPGNIGEGKRWGAEFESTLSLEWLGLTGVRLDIKGRWQDSVVLDPATGEKRELSADGGFRGPPAIRYRSGNKYAFDIGLRQDFDTARVAWGFKVVEQAKRPRYKVNELDIYNEGVELVAFIETTRWFGLKARIEGNNLLDFTEIRDRTIFTGVRNLSPVETRMIQERNSGRRVTLTLSGSF